MGQGLLIFEDPRSHWDAPHWLRLHWTSDQPNTVPSTWQHTIFTRDRHAHTGIRTRNPSKRAAEPHALDRAVTATQYQACVKKCKPDMHVVQHQIIFFFRVVGWVDLLLQVLAFWACRLANKHVATILYESQKLWHARTHYCTWNVFQSSMRLVLRTLSAPFAACVAHIICAVCGLCCAHYLRRCVLKRGRLVTDRQISFIQNVFICYAHKCIRQHERYLSVSGD